MIRACQVTGAGRPRRGSACYESKKGTGRGCTPGSCFVCTAFRRHEPPYWGAPGGFSPGPFFPPFLWEEMGAPAGQARPARGHPGARTGNPSSAPVCALGHLPPTGGKVGLRADGIRPYGRPGNHPVGAAALGGPFRLDRSRAARRGRRAPRAGGSGGGGMISTPTGWGSYPPAGQAPPYPSSSRSTCPAERAKSRAAARASWRVLPWVPTSTSTEPVDSCWLYREERMVMGRARVG